MAGRWIGPCSKCRKTASLAWVNDVALCRRCEHGPYRCAWCGLELPEYFGNDAVCWTCEARGWTPDLTHRWNARAVAFILAAVSMLAGFALAWWLRQP